MFGDNEGVELLLKEGASVNIQERFPDDILGPDYNYGFFSAEQQVNCCGIISPLHLAVHRKRYAIVEKLLQYGANPHLEDNAGRSALDYSIAWNDLDLVTIFMKNGAEVNAINALGLSPLHVALNCKADFIIPLLVEHGADIEKRSPRNGYTPLFRACLSAIYVDKSLKLVSLFVLANADLEIPCARENVVTDTADTAVFEGMCIKFFKSFLSIRHHIITRAGITRLIRELHMLRMFAMAGAVVHKDTVRGRSVSALYQNWARMENAVQDWESSALPDSERQFIVDCIQLIKQRLVQPASLMELCRLRIRCTLRPDFHRKLAMLHLPRMTRCFLEMKNEFPLESFWQEKSFFLTTWNPLMTCFLSMTSICLTNINKEIKKSFLNFSSIVGKLSFCILYIYTFIHIYIHIYIFIYMFS